MAISQHNIDLNINGLNQLKTYQTQLRHAAKRMRELTAAQAKREAKGRTDTKVYKQQAKTLANYSAKHKQLKGDIDRTTESLRKNATMMNHQNTSTKKAAKNSKNLGKAMAVMGLSIAGAAMAVRRLVTFMVSSLKTFAEFEKGVKNVTTLLSARDAGIFRGDLFKGSLNISKQYGFALKDVNKAMFNAVSAGVKAGDAVKFLNEASVLAIAGVTDLKSATLGLTTVLNAYGMEMTEADRISEILFTTQKFGVTTVSELSKAIGVVVPFAAASGISMEELGASIAVTTRSGLDAAKTVTALRAAISQMQKPAAESRDLFIKWGIPIGAAQMKAVGYTETLRRLNKVYKESPRDIELMFGNVRGLTAIFSLAGENAEQYGTILEQIVTDTGDASSVQKGLAENTDSAAMELARLGTAFDNLKVAIGDNEGIRNFVKELTDLLNILGSDKVSSAEKQTTGLMWALDKFGKFFTLLGPKTYSIMPEDLIEFDENSKGAWGTVTEKILSDEEREEALAKFDEFEELLFNENEKITNILANLGYGYKNMGEEGTAMAQLEPMSPMDIDADMIEEMERYVSAANQINPQIWQEQMDKELSSIDEMINPLKLFLDSKAALEEGARKKTEEGNKLAGEQAQAFDKRELEKRQNTIEAINKIKMDALLTDEYANETSLKISKAKLKEITALEESLSEVNKDGVLVRKANAEQIQAIENEKAAIILKIKQQTIINERKNTKAYDDAVIKAKTEMEQNIHDITLKGIKDGEDADGIKLKTLSEKKKFYDTILGFAGQTENTYADTLKNLSKIEIDFLKLGDKMDVKDTPQYQRTKREALLHFSEFKAKIQKQEINEEITSFEARKKILKAEFEMYQALHQNEGASHKEKIKSKSKMTEIEVEQMRNEFNEFQLIEDQKNEIRMQGLQMAADFAQQLSDAGMNNFLQRQEKEKQSLQDKLDAGLISQGSYDKRMEAMEKKAFERKKKQEQSNAVIAYVMELANIAVQAAANKANAWTWGTAGLKQYAALAAIASARFIATTASISAQKYADGGMVYGNSHAQGGEKFAVGGRVVELEGGEAVINKRSASMFRNELSAMNVAGGGVDFSRGVSRERGIDYGLLASLIGENTNVVLPVESLNEVQNKVKTIEDGSRF